MSEPLTSTAAWPAGPRRIPVQVPPVERRFAYAAAYWPLTLRNLVVPHRLRADRARTYSTPFTPHPDAAQRWCRVFSIDERAARGAPFLYGQAAGTLLYMRLFADLGLNFRHLLHLAHQSTHLEPAHGVAQQVTARVSKVALLGASKAVVTVRSDVARADGHPLLHTEDRFVVRGYAPAQLQGLPMDDSLRCTSFQLARQAPRLRDAGVWRLPVPVAQDLGRRYGQLSGDMNPVHTTPWAARLFGHRRPFLQGLGTRNLVVGHLAAAGLKLQRLELHLCRPVMCGQILTLAHDGRQIELTDARHTLLACGQFHAVL